MLISITQLRNTALTSSSPPMAWTKLRRVLISMSARFSILEISACLTLRFLASVFLSEGKSLARFRQGHVLPQLLLALLNAPAALWAEVLGEFREGAGHGLGWACRVLRCAS